MIKMNPTQLKTKIMKKLVFILMFLLPVSLIAQKAVEVTGYPTKAKAARAARNAKSTEVNLSPVEVQVTGESIMTMGYSVTKVPLAELISRYAEDPAYSSFEIDEEMFKAFGELEYVDSMSMSLFK
jgi:hypothetical protein